MTTEQQLREALRAVDGYQPSPDLWARVEGSIEADRLHRRRLMRLFVGIASAVAVLVAVAMLSLVGVGDQRRVDWRALELVETAVLATLVLGLGPAIRRFGRTFASDVFRVNPPTSRSFLRLLDVAFYLVFGGYILVTSSFVRPGLLAIGVLADQLGDAALRIGGLLLLMGVLHVVTLLALPVLGIAFTSGWRHDEADGDGPGRAARPLPPWVLVVGVAALAGCLVVVAFFVVIGTGV